MLMAVIVNLKVIQKMSVPKTFIKNFTDAQDKHPFALGRRKSSFGCMKCVTFASKFCFI